MALITTTSRGSTVRELKRILAVIDPTAASQPAAERAAALARSIGARLELFICEYNSQLVDSAPAEHHGLPPAEITLATRVKLMTMHSLPLGQPAR